MAPSIAAFFAIQLLIFCAAHAARPRLWADFFVAMGRTGFASLIIPMYTLPLGMLLILGHNIWAWDWRVLVTVAGWMMATKSVIYLLVPGAPERMIANADRWESGFGGFRMVGIVGAALGAFLTWKAVGTMMA